MDYLAIDGDILSSFETTLELVVDGPENHVNHKLHQRNGYEHGLGDFMNQEE